MSEPTAAYTPAPESAEPRFAPGELLTGRFRVVAPLGNGGMGEVYRADDLTLGQPVALKFLPAGVAAAPSRLARFRKEVAAARQVSHPHVCRVYDLGEHAGQPFLAMEFVDGEDLASVLVRLGRVSAEKGVEIARQLVGALAAVHDRGLVHRDLKPANVMLDGRGQVRLTDFGLAAAAEELSGVEVRSGTPAYQAPEQRAGRAVTARSDLYALGLVLHELFTGKRPGKPGSEPAGLDPTVERVIRRCLAADPADRPASAAAVLAVLPGGDPLAAAVAAGETPSPQLVADAGADGTLPPAVAVGLFAVVVAGLLVIAVLNDRWKPYRKLPLPPPAVLDEKARELVRTLGYTDRPRDTAGGFETPAYAPAVIGRQTLAPDLSADQLADCRPAVTVYWHRQHRRPMAPVRSAAYLGRADRLGADNPPATEPGMVVVWIDTRGRLVSLDAAPDPAAEPAVGGWGPLLAAAGLDIPGALRPDPAAAVVPPVFADQTAVWDGHYPDRPEVRVRVEAASFRGRPVFFRLTHPDWPGATAADPTPTALVAATAVLVGFLAAMLVLAVRNIRRGRADLRGAGVVAVFILGCQMLHWALAAGHFPALTSLYPLFVNQLAHELYTSAYAAASYLALEPIVRRRCPHRLTGWTRLAAGRWRDPLVGRQVLAGLVAAAACSLAEPLRPLTPSLGGPVVVHPTAFTRPVGGVIGEAGAAVGISWFYAGMFGVCLAVARREWVGVPVVGGLALVGLAVAGEPAVLSALALATVAAAVGLFLRLGILALVAFTLGMSVLGVAPLTLDPAAWYFGAGLVHALPLAGLAGYAAWASLGGRRLFREGLFADD